MNLVRTCCLVVALVAASATTAACRGVEHRTGVIAAPSFDGETIVDQHPRGAVFRIDLDRGVRNYRTIRAGAPREHISCASGAEFTPELAVPGTSVEFDIDTGQDFETSDPPGFGVTNLVIDC